MLPLQLQELLDKYASGACSPDEEQFINDWYNNIGKKAHVLSQEDNFEVQRKIWAAINPSPAPEKTWIPFLSRAAMITIPLLACVAFYLNRQSLSEIIRPPVQENFVLQLNERSFVNDGKTARKIALADGSEVILEPSSEIHIREDFGGASRKVRLEGEAFFNVHPDPEKPFVVYSNEVVTRVLGTSFRVKAFDNDGEITVAVRTGRVSVYTNKCKEPGVSSAQEHEEVILTPNQQIVYHRVQEKVSKQLVEKPEIILPNSDLFKMQFENAEVSNIFEVLKENYGVEIRYDKYVLNNCKLTTSMSDEGLYDRIEVICKAIGASYTIDDDAVITISSDGC